MGRILAIDYGTKRIGIAISDETKIISFAKPYITAAEKHRLHDFITENNIEKIILGLPRALSGNETDSTRRVREFMVWLGQKTTVPIELVDERLSTKEILRSENNRELVDSLVAQKLLERYLETKS